MEEEIPETAFEPRSQTYHSMRSAVLDRGLALSKKDQSSSSPPDSPGIKPFQRFILTVSVLSQERSGSYKCMPDFSSLGCENLTLRVKKNDLLGCINRSLITDVSKIKNAM